MAEINLTAEQLAEAERIEDAVKGAAGVEIRQLARLLASKPNSQLLGATEFLVRDGVHRIGVRLLEAALEERKKGGTAGAARSVQNATSPPSSRSIARAASAR